MAGFRKRSDVELARLEEDELVAYVSAAREAGESDAMVEALRIFAYRREPTVRSFVAARLGSRGDAVVDQVAEQAIFDAVVALADFKGDSTGEAGGFVMRIVRRRIADYMRKGRLDTWPLEWDGEDGEAKSVALGTGDRYERVADWNVINQAFQECSTIHKRVLTHFIFEDLSARDAAAAVNRHFSGADTDSMTEDNVNQIASRFRKRVRELLDEAAAASPADHD